MSSFNPIIPPGSPLQRTRQRNSSFFVAVFTVVAVHVIFLAGLLIQGCKREDRNPTGPEDTSMSLQSSNAAAGEQTQLAPEPGTMPRQTDATVTGSVPMSTPGVPGPGALPQTTPPSVSDTVRTGAEIGSTPAPPPVSPEPPTAQTTYVVKSGDTLTKIARAHGTTIKAIRAASGLKTDRILVGQKLKVPSGKTAGGQ